MTDDGETTEELSRRQLAQIKAAREAEIQAHTESEAEKHKRRADKAEYLREKLEQQRRADEGTEPKQS